MMNYTPATKFPQNIFHSTRKEDTIEKKKQKHFWKLLDFYLRFLIEVYETPSKYSIVIIMIKFLLLLLLLFQNSEFGGLCI